MRELAPHTSIESLRKEAKSWLEALRAGDPAARARLRAALPDAPDAPGLRDVQLAVAREHGLPGWSALRQRLEDLALARRDRAELAEEVLKSAWQGDPAAARQILSRVPDLPRDSLFLAAMAGDVDEVRRRLARAPATATGGPLRWQPLQYLAYGRLPGAEVHAVEIATLLLDAGASADAAFDDGWGNDYTVLNGVIGQGETSRPEHPRADALAALLLDRGARAFDPQVLYDTSLHRDETRWLDLLWARSDPGPWRTHLMAGHPMLDYLLGNAVERDHVRRIEWLLTHGADPDALHAYAHVPVQVRAQLLGHAGVVALLEAHGATPHRLSGPLAFQAAALRGDADEARRLAAEDPSCLTHPGPLVAAAQRDLDDVAALLLELGLAADLCPPDQKRALHWAAQCGSVRVARRLIAAGADVDRRGSEYQGTPLGFALHFDQRAMIELLVPLTRDVFGLAQAAALARLAEVLREDPSRIRDRNPRGEPLLFALPDDEAAAVDVAELLLAHGADPRATSAAGETPAQAARRRGLVDAAEILEAR
jgi:hypothetical protein